MRRFAVVFLLAASLAAVLGAFACGPGSDKPPLTPDPTDEAGAPSAPAPPSSGGK